MNPVTSATAYFKGVQNEVKKVVWPTFPTLMKHVASVILGLALFTAFVGAVDYVFINALALLVR